LQLYGVSGGDNKKREKKRKRREKGENKKGRKKRRKWIIYNMDSFNGSIFSDVITNNYNPPPWLVKLNSRMGDRTQLLTLALAGTETWGSFARVYAQVDSEVSAPVKAWIKSGDRLPGLTEVEISRLVGLTEVSGDRRQLLTPALAGAETRGSFAHVYAQGDPKVSAPGKPWSKSWDRPLTEVSTN
jgi:hypothetical protein